jgi:hypothetical protein
MNDKRKEHRLKATIPIKLVTSRRRELIGQTGNISRLGAYVELEKEVPVGEDVDVTLEIPAYQDDVSLAGEVRCTGNIFRCSIVHESSAARFYGTGIFFTGFASPRDREKLSAYVDFLIAREEQEIKEGVRRRKDKETSEKKIRQSADEQAHQAAFQKQTLALLKDISSRLEKLERMFKSEKRA